MLQMVALLHWAHTYCTDVDNIQDPIPFVLKSEDDVHVNVDNLMRVVMGLNREEERSIYGTRRILADEELQLLRSQVSYGVWPWSNFATNYILWPDAFLMTGTALTFLLAAAQTTPYFILDDIYFSGLLCSRESMIQVLVSDRYVGGQHNFNTLQIVKGNYYCAG